MEPWEIHEVAHRIADRLFRTGFGERATRLELVQDEPHRSLGGWSYGAAVEQIRAVLQTNAASDAHS